MTCYYCGAARGHATGCPGGAPSPPQAAVTAARQALERPIEFDERKREQPRNRLGWTFCALSSVDEIISLEAGDSVHAGEGGGEVKIYIITEVEGDLTDSYHSGGGLAVIAKDEAHALAQLGAIRTVKLAEDDWAKAECYELAGEPEPKVWIFPDAGCC